MRAVPNKMVSRKKEPRPTRDASRYVLPAEMQNDEVQRLVVLAQSGDVEALNELFTRYNDVMVEMARRRLGPRLRLKEDADDLAQTTFREATRDFAQYEYRAEIFLDLERYTGARALHGRPRERRGREAPLRSAQRRPVDHAPGPAQGGVRHPARGAVEPLPRPPQGDHPGLLPRPHPAPGRRADGRPQRGRGADAPAPR